MPARSRAHRRGSYQTQAAAVRAAAYADPTTRCRRCGLTLADKPGDTWDAGHIHDGVPGSPLAAEHSSCNRSAGATAGNLRRQGLRLRHDY
jgi:hypothetical protein